MSKTAAFAEGVGAGVGLVLILSAIVLLSRHRRALTAALRRLDDAARSGRSLWTGEPPANYLDVCRSAGL